MYWAELGKKKWIYKIDKENPSMSDISWFLNITNMQFHHRKEREAFDKRIKGIIRRSGPYWTYKHRDQIKTDYVSRIKPGWLTLRSYEDREQRRKAAMKKEGTGSSAGAESPRPTFESKRKRRFLTYNSSDPPKRGILKTLLWRPD